MLHERLQIPFNFVFIRAHKKIIIIFIIIVNLEIDLQSARRRSNNTLLSSTTTMMVMPMTMMLMSMQLMCTTTTAMSAIRRRFTLSRILALFNIRIMLRASSRCISCRHRRDIGNIFGRQNKQERLSPFWIDRVGHRLRTFHFVRHRHRRVGRGRTTAIHMFRRRGQFFSRHNLHHNRDTALFRHHQRIFVSIRGHQRRGIKLPRHIIAHFGGNHESEQFAVALLQRVHDWTVIVHHRQSKHTAIDLEQQIRQVHFMPLFIRQNGENLSHILRRHHAIIILTQRRT
mmetsp:Transcript_8696/g.13419  ORF Transcript_8696/g.13419 Transcript_8696/m.13419 type:complete len:286 (+) Transcript_8696:352-1209(+)